MVNLDNKKLKDLTDLFSKAEGLIKKSEATSDGVIIPSINELRYFGFHLLKAISEQDENKAELQLDKAEAHAKRAIYDATESIALFHIMKAEAFQERFSTSIFITEVIPDYIEMQTKLHAAREAIDHIKRDASSYLNRDQVYEHCSPHMKEVTDISLKLDLATHIIAKMDADKQKQEFDRQQEALKATRRFKIIISVSMAVAIIGAIKLIP